MPMKIIRIQSKQGHTEECLSYWSMANKSAVSTFFSYDPRYISEKTVNNQSEIPSDGTFVVVERVGNDVATSIFHKGQNLGTCNYHNGDKEFKKDGNTINVINAVGEITPSNIETTKCKIDIDSANSLKDKSFKEIKAKYDAIAQAKVRPGKKRTSEVTKHRVQSTKSGAEIHFSQDQSGNEAVEIWSNGKKAYFATPETKGKVEQPVVATVSAPEPVATVSAPPAASESLVPPPAPPLPHPLLSDLAGQVVPVATAAVPLVISRTPTGEYLEVAASVASSMVTRVMQSTGSSSSDPAHSVVDGVRLRTATGTSLDHRESSTDSTSKVMENVVANLITKTPTDQKSTRPKPRLVTGTSGFRSNLCGI